MLITFGHLLRNHRLQRGLRQQDIATPVDVDGSYIARLEMDERKPSRHVVIKIATALGLNADERDQMLAAAKHLPEGDIERLVAQSGVALTHPVVQAISNAFAELSPASRDILAEEIIAYVGFRVGQLKEQEQAKARRPLEYA